MQKNIIHKMTFTGMMLALVILFQYLEKLMPFGDIGFVKFNLSLAFILVTVVQSGYMWAFLLLILRFVLGPLLSGSGYSSGEVIGQIILFVSGLIVISLFYLLKSKDNSYSRWQKIYRTLLIIVFTSIIMASLNALVFTPWYLGSYGGFWRTIGLSEAIKSYDSIKQFYFGIPSYYGGQFSVYILFNVLNLLMVSVIAFPLLKIVRILSHRN